MRQKLGAILYDLPRFLWSMRPSSRRTWVHMRNREERLTAGPNGCGVLCDWEWTSDLHLAGVFPFLGHLLMNRALRSWPIGFQDEPIGAHSGKIKVSFIIGHRGMQRLPHLLLTLRSIAAQREILVECIVVEQSPVPEAKDHLPAWIRYIHTPLPFGEMPYCRSWAFNIGARCAGGDVLVLHDNDMLLPEAYASEVLARVEQGYEVANLKRFIFYLNESHSAGLLSGGLSICDEAPEAVVQNLEAGGSVAITRDAYFAIGGFDESFVGWGGEDNEFWERAQTRLVWPYGYLPIVHAWHSAQAGKFDSQRSTGTLYDARSAIPATERIAELRLRDFGNPEVAPLDLASAEYSSRS